MSSNDSDNERILRVAALVLSNAFLFHELLARSEGEVDTLRQVMRSDDPVGEFLDQWEYITEEIDYAPIFDMASDVLIRLPSSPETINGIESLVESALSISQSRAALRHDLMGRIFHRLISNPKYYGTRYTKIPAANLLLRLTTGEMDDKLSSEEEIKDLKVGDLACGTGTLLKSSLSGILDEYIRSSVERGEEVSTHDVHPDLVEDGLWGFDVRPSAVHLAATGLALHDPEVKVNNMRIYALPLGGPNNRLGSIDFARDRKFLVQQTLFGETLYSAEKIIEENNNVDDAESVELPKFDLLAMNPPFTRDVYGSFLYGDLGDEEREGLKDELRKVRDEQDLQANVRPGIGTVFVALADRVIKNDGTLSLVLPKTLLSGSDWGKTRDVLDDYHIKYIISSHEPDNWNFSEETGLSELMLVANKDSDGDETYYVNLWEQPEAYIESLSLSNIVKNADKSDIDEQGVSELRTDGMKFGEIVRAKPQAEDDLPWVLPSAFAQTELARIGYYLNQGELYVPGRGKVGEIPLADLNNKATLGPDWRDVYDAFSTTESETEYLALRGMDAEEANSLSQEPNLYLSPLSEGRGDRSLVDSDRMWGKAGSLMLPKEFWLATNSVGAVVLPSKALSNVWWPTRWDGTDEDENRKMERRLALWLNSSLGLLSMLMRRQDTRGPFVKFPKTWWKNSEIVDLDALDEESLEKLDQLWDEIHDEELDPFPDMTSDSTRIKIDNTFAEILDLEGLDTIRNYLSREPVVSDSRIN